MGKFKHIQLQALDRHLAEVSVPVVPSGGWIRAVRLSLGMTIQQLAGRMSIAKQSLARLEANEAGDSITLKSLRRAAEALDCRLVYALVPNERGLQGILDKQAFKKAQSIVAPVDHTMRLEDQGVGDLSKTIEETARDLSKYPNSSLWE